MRKKAEDKEARKAARERKQQEQKNVKGKPKHKRVKRTRLLFESEDSDSDIQFVTSEEEDEENETDARPPAKASEKRGSKIQPSRPKRKPKAGLNKNTKKARKQVISVADTSEQGTNTTDEHVAEESDEDTAIIQRHLQKDPEEGDYVLVEFQAKPELKYYVGKVIGEKDHEGDLEVSYLRRSLKCETKFVMPNIPDLNSVSINDIKMILPKPTSSGTRRQQGNLDFNSPILCKLNVG